MLAIQSKRLLIREFTPKDAQAMIAFASHEAITKWLPDWCDCADWIDGWLQTVCENYTIDDPMKQFLAYAVVEKHSNNIVGHIGCGDLDGLELGICYAVDPSHGGKGYATEAMRSFIPHVFDTYGVDHLVATIQPDNIASIRVAEKLGFTFIKEIERLDNGQTVALPFRYFHLHR